MKLPPYILLTLSFLEGAAVLAVELIVAKMLAPVYGDSIYVWTTVIGITITGLSVGYFMGGILIDKYKDLNQLFYVLLAAASVILFIPAILNHLTEVFIDSDIIFSVVIISISVLFPSLLFLGMVPSMIIGIWSGSVETVGEKAGNVYAISTIGGITSAFFMGFYIIPRFGLTIPVIAVSIILAMIPIYFLLVNRKYLSLTYIFFVVLIFFFKVIQPAPLRSGNHDEIKVHYYSEGLLGQVMVCDYVNNTARNSFENKKYVRSIYINRMAQTVIDLETKQPVISDYIKYMNALVSIYQPGSRVLLLGLGGGNLVREFTNLGFSVDICELDKRIVYAANKYFLNDLPSFVETLHATSLQKKAGIDNKRTNFIIDDARHFLKTTENKYDLVVFDVFKGESPPTHVFTKESIKEVQSILNPNGAIIVNLIGQIEGEKGKGVRSVLKTFDKSGLETNILQVPHVDNVLISGSFEPLEFKVKANPNYLHNINGRIEHYFYDYENLRLWKDEVLTDDEPVLDWLYIDAMKATRKWYTANYTKKFLEKDVPLFW
ncbi:MAG: hypothetical protein FVQ77_17185 [Cytophagales bacterium]|nr:hypothetical protein [Cytophagales bacterium]